MNCDILCHNFNFLCHYDLPEHDFFFFYVVEMADVSDEKGKGNAFIKCNIIYIQIMLLEINKKISISEFVDIHKKPYRKYRSTHTHRERETHGVFLGYRSRASPLKRGHCYCITGSTVLSGRVLNYRLTALLYTFM